MMLFQLLDFFMGVYFQILLIVTIVTNWMIELIFLLCSMLSGMFQLTIDKHPVWLYNIGIPVSAGLAVNVRRLGQ